MTGGVVVTYLHAPNVTHSFTNSLLRMIDHDRGRHLVQWQSMSCGSGGLVEARNKASRGFLDGGIGEWLLMIDTDMGWQPDALDLLMAAADPVERPVVGGLCFVHKETEPDGCGGFRSTVRPTIFDWIETPEGPRFAGRGHYPVNRLVRAAGTGAAFLLVHRRVLAEIADAHGDTWFTRIKGSDGSLLGEDVSFCARLAAIGVPLHVHTGVKVTHMKPTWLGEHDFWRGVLMPPAADETAVIVPVLRRPEHAAPFMASLRASTGLATCYAVVQDGDDEAEKAWAAAGAVIVPSGDRTTFAQKVNDGYRASLEPWLFLVGSDVRFHPGWLDHAQAIGNTYEAHLVGTNDLGNPRVMAGAHATHMLVRRSYVDEVGASWDGPGVVCHEGYRHWFVDDELVTAAKLRDVWQMAIGSIVEHLHPLWGKGENDDVYELGQSHGDHDRQVFQARYDRHRHDVRAA